jgi:formiminotetrahydrofolate cyclodeaminase
VAAESGALGAALASMVCRLSIGKKQFNAVKDELTNVRDEGDKLRAELTTLVETDKDAFNKVMEAFKLPEGSERDEGVEAANKHAAEVPLTVMGKSLEVLKLASIVAAKGNQNSITDSGVAALMALAAVHGAGYNVRINLTSIKDKEFVAKLKEDAAVITLEAETLARQIKEVVESNL